jgi:transposase-like protein
MQAQKKPEVLSVYDFLQRFPDDKAARSYLEARRWPQGRCCPHCGSVRTTQVKNEKPMPYRCQDCRQHFSIRTGTILAESKIALHKWLFAVYLRDLYTFLAFIPGSIWPVAL